MSSTVLVTGASKGIGRAIALGLAERGHDVAINDAPSEAAGLGTLAAAIEASGRRTLVVPADVSVKADVAGMVRAHGEWVKLQDTRYKSQASNLRLPITWDLKLGSCYWMSTPRLFISGKWVKCSSCMLPATKMYFLSWICPSM